MIVRFSTWRRLALTIAALCLFANPLAASDSEPAGRKELLAQKCDKCHAIARVEIEAKVKSEKMKGPDLGGVGAKHSAEWMAKYLRNEVDLEGKDHKGKWEGSAKQLETIVAWLATLKEEGEE